MTKSGRIDVQPSFLLFYRGDDELKIRIFSKDALSGEFIVNDPNVEEKFIDRFDDLKIYQIPKYVHLDFIYDLIIGATFSTELKCSTTIKSTENSLSWQDYFNQSKQHHWESLWTIIAERICDPDNNDPLDLTAELKKEFQPSAVRSLLAFISEYENELCYQLSYRGHDGLWYWRLLSSFEITQAQLVAEIIDRDEQWLNAVPFNMTTNQYPMGKLKVQMTLPPGYVSWDAMLNDLTRTKCLSLFTEIKDHFNDPELRKVVHIGD